METKRPTQKSVEVALDYLVNNIVQKEANEENFERLSHAIKVFGNSYFNYDVEKYKQIYDELKQEYEVD